MGEIIEIPAEYLEQAQAVIRSLNKPGKKDCDTCRYYYPKDRITCGLGSGYCVNTKSRPYHQGKGELPYLA